MKQLSDQQKSLFIDLKKYIGKNTSLEYDKLKKLCGCKSFDTSFNALLLKGYIKRVETSDFSNKFKLV